jgi:hypothetical protein
MANNIGTEIWQFIKLNFKFLLIAGVALFLYGQGCFDRSKTQPPTIVVVRDTTYTEHTGGGPSNPVIINNIPANPKEIPPTYKPDASYEGLVKQYNELAATFLSKNTYSDRLKIDTLGYVDVRDTVSQNRLAGRSYNFNIKERLITNTITITNPPRNQWFIGAGVQSDLNKTNIRQVDVSLLLKNKKENIVGLSAGYLISTKSMGVGVHFYKKISLKKAIVTTVL